MKRRTLQVRIHAREPSIVEVTVGDKVQLDRVVPSGTRYAAERCGDLLEPGTTQLALAQGFYCFRTLSDASLRVVSGGADTATNNVGNDKDPWPDPPPRITNPPTPPPPPGSFGDEGEGDVPAFRVL